MSGTPFPNGDDPISADLQKALTAAFGDEAMNWTEDDPVSDALTEIDSSTSGIVDEELASAISQLENAGDSTAALDDLLKQVSAAIEEDTDSTAVFDPADDPGSAEGDLSQEVGPRHVVFEIGNQQFGMPLTGVLEIDRCGQVTSLPRTPRWLRGVTNLRGQILSVTDFRHLLNLNSDRQTVGEKIIVVHSQRHAASTALVVDRVLGIRNLRGEQGPLSSISDRVASFSDGISVTDQATTVLIAPDLLLGCRELQSFAKK